MGHCALWKIARVFEVRRLVGLSRLRSSVRERIQTTPLFDVRLFAQRRGGGAARYLAGAPVSGWAPEQFTEKRLTQSVTLAVP